MLLTYLSIRWPHKQNHKGVSRNHTLVFKVINWNASMHLYLVSSSVSTWELFNIYPEDQTRVTIPYLESSEFSVKKKEVWSGETRVVWLNQDKAVNTAVRLCRDLNIILKSVNVIWEMGKSCGKQGMETAWIQIVAMYMERRRLRNSWANFANRITLGDCYTEIALRFLDCKNR